MVNIDEIYFYQPNQYDKQYFIYTIKRNSVCVCVCVCVCVSSDSSKTTTRTTMKFATTDHHPGVSVIGKGLVTSW